MTNKIAIGPDFLSNAFKLICNLQDRPAILILKNTKSKTALMFICKSAIAKMCELMQNKVQKRLDKTQRDFLSQDNAYLEVEVCNYMNDIIALKILSLKVKTELNASGYTILNNKVHFRPIIVTAYGRDKHNRRFLFVEMQSYNRKTKLTLGVFNNREEAKAFVSACYSTKPFYLCYAYNGLTRRFFEEQPDTEQEQQLRL